MLYECYVSVGSSKMDWRLGGFLALTAVSIAISYYILGRKTTPDSEEEISTEKPSRVSTPILLRRGDEVGYTRYFLRQMATPPNDPMWSRLGKVEAVHGYMTMVRWGDGEVGPIHCANLARPGTERWSE